MLLDQRYDLRQKQATKESKAKVAGSEGKHQALASDELIQFGIVLIPTPSLIGVRVGPIPTTHDRAASLGPATRTHLRARNAYQLLFLGCTGVSPFVSIRIAMSS